MDKATKIEKEEIRELAPTNQAPFQIENLISQAITKKVPVETMERLLAMRKQLKDEWAKEQYDRAMAKLQRELPVIEKKSEAGNNNFNYKYAPLEYINEKTKKPIADNGFSYYFDTEEDVNFMTIYCHTTHEAGFTKTSKFRVPIDKSARMNATQQYGSALTYGKRYCFCNAFGIVVGGEDNDAQLIGKAEQPKKPTYQPASRPPAIVRISLDQIKEVENLMKDKGKTLEDVNGWVIKAFPKSGYKHFKQLEKGQADFLIKALKKMPDLQPEPDVAEPTVDPDEAEKGIQKMHEEEAKK